MNRTLVDEITKHILANLGIIKSTFVNLSKTKLLKSKEFLLDETLSFQLEDDVKKNKIWGCQISSEQQELKILLGDCSTEDDIPEYCLIVQLKDTPAYGLYFIDNTNIYQESLIACTINGNDWMECQTFLQATFLAGMEQIREIGLAWNKCIDYKDQYDLMLSYIKYHNSVYEDKNYEGEKN